MRRSCDVCGEGYDAKRSSSKFCGSRCRQQSRRAPVVEVVVSHVPPSLVEAVRRELAEAGREDTALGQAALVLAAQTGNLRDTGSAVASVIREMRATLAEALKGADVKADGLDELRLRRDAKRTG